MARIRSSGLPLTDRDPQRFVPCIPEDTDNGVCRFAGVVAYEAVTDVILEKEQKIWQAVRGAAGRAAIRITDKSLFASFSSEKEESLASGGATGWRRMAKERSGAGLCRRGRCSVVWFGLPAMFRRQTR